MVRIIDGEIVQDDDPRLHQSGRSGAAASPGPGYGGYHERNERAGSTQGQSVFDWNAPFLRFVPSAASQGGIGLPDVEFFGFRVSSVLLISLAVFMLVGWKAVLIMAILYFIWRTHQHRHQAAFSGGAAGGVGNFMQRYMQMPPPARGGIDRGVRQPGGGSAAGGSSFTGRAFKLND